MFIQQANQKNMSKGQTQQLTWTFKALGEHLNENDHCFKAMFCCESKNLPSAIKLLRLKTMLCLNTKAKWFRENSSCHNVAHTHPKYKHGWLSTRSIFLDTWTDKGQPISCNSMKPKLAITVKFVHEIFCGSDYENRKSERCHFTSRALPRCKSAGVLICHYPCNCTI